MLATNVAALAIGPPAVVLTELTGAGSTGGPDRRYVIEVKGLDPELLESLGQASLTPEDWRRVFPVFIVESGSPTGGGGQPSVLGAYLVTPGGVRFTPRFALQEGTTYLAELYLAELRPDQLSSAPREPLNTTVSARLTVPERRRAPTRVLAVFPSSAVLPENLLRFYLHFSGPMRRGVAYRHIHLIDAAGNEVELPFLELEQELWDRDGRRLTLLLDPGRIKSGLVPRRELGPALQGGSTYSLVIDRVWPDAFGRSLASGFERSFTVGAPDTSPPDPGRWHLSSPPAAGREPLVVELGETLDHALLHRLIWITGPARHDTPLPSRLEIGPDERRLEITPEKPWTPGPYLLHVGADLEDVAGNNVTGPFERDLEHPDERADKRPLAVAFDVR